MKAAVYYETGPPDVFRYEDLPDPAVFPGGVVIDVEAISIEGGDTLNRAGGEMTSTPHIVGYQCAGTISEVGEGVDDRHVGQKVVATMMSGSHAEKVAVPALITWPIPDGADVVACACVPVAFGTADDCSSNSATSQRARAFSSRPAPAAWAWPPSSWPRGPAR